VSNREAAKIEPDRTGETVSLGLHNRATGAADHSPVTVLLCVFV
jgi:hypothetical protein